MLWRGWSRTSDFLAGSECSLDVLLEGSMGTASEHWICVQIKVVLYLGTGEEKLLQREVNVKKRLFFHSQMSWAFLSIGISHYRR